MNYKLDTEARTVIIDDEVYHIQSEVFELISKLIKEAIAMEPFQKVIPAARPGDIVNRDRAGKNILIQFPTRYKEGFEKRMTDNSIPFKIVPENELKGMFLWDPEKVMYYMISEAYEKQTFLLIADIQQSYIKNHDKL